MKKSWVLLGVASALALAGCGKSGTDENTQTDISALTDNTINDQAASPDLNSDEPGAAVNSDAAIAVNTTGNAL